MPPAPRSWKSRRRRRTREGMTGAQDKGPIPAGQACRDGPEILTHCEGRDRITPRPPAPPSRRLASRTTYDRSSARTAPDATAPSARSKASSSVETQWNSSCDRTSSGMSSRSASLSLGRMTRVIPARCAPRTFSFTPPIGRTRPRSVISPVMATSRSTGRPDIAEAIAVAIATPALGPSLGMAPAGTWTWTSIEPRRFAGDGELARVRRGVGHRGAVPTPSSRRRADP